MDSIITVDLNEITISSGLLKLISSKGELIVDIKKMIKEPIGSENAYFNATRVAEFFPSHKKLSKFMNLTSTKEYIEILEEEFGLITPKKGQSKNIKTSYIKRGRETKENKGSFGTYLHNELFFKYLSWCSARFEREIHKTFKQIILHSNELKISRSESKILFLPLTDSIRNIFIPAQRSDNSKKFAYSTLANLINLRVLGCSSKKFIHDNNLSKDIPLRDQLNDELLSKIKSLEEDLNGFIKYGNITNYEELKVKIS